MRDNDGIYKRPESPFWWAFYKDSNGKACRKSTGARIAEDPQGIAAQQARERMMHPEPAGKTWDDLIAAYLEGPHGLKAWRTRKGIEASLRTLYPTFTGRALDSIGAADVRGWIAARKAAGKADGTVRNEVAIMSAVTSWAQTELEWSAPNPWKGRKPQTTPPRGRWLSREEAQALLDAASGHLADYIRLCLYAGLRKSEALQLEWRRVDLVRGLILFDSGHGVGGQKSGIAGSVPINQQARVALLSRHREKSGPWVFAWPTGERVKTVQKSFAAAVRLAGLTDVTQHDLRRTFGSWLAQSGVPIQQISRLMRHQDISITHRVYAHLCPGVLADAAGALDSAPVLRSVNKA